MTSDKAQSNARRELDLFFGERRVSLKRLKPKEFDSFLSRVLRDIDLRELRGFKPLEDQLSHRRDHNSVNGMDPTDDVSVPLRTQVVEKKSQRQPFGLNTHVVSAHRGVISQTLHYRRNESGEETTDWKVARSWKNGGYTFRLEGSILVLRRPSDHSRADENLFLVRYVAEKVPLEHRMEVASIEVIPVPISRFRMQFGSKYSSVAQDLIWELRSIASRTLDALRGKAEAFRPIVAKLDLIGGAISE